MHGPVRTSVLVRIQVCASWAVSEVATWQEDEDGYMSSTDDLWEVPTAIHTLHTLGLPYRPLSQSAITLPVPRSPLSHDLGVRQPKSLKSSRNQDDVHRQLLRLRRPLQPHHPHHTSRPRPRRFYRRMRTHSQHIDATLALDYSDPRLCMFQPFTPLLSSELI